MGVRFLLAWPRPATVRRSPLPEAGRSSQIERTRRAHLVAAATGGVDDFLNTYTYDLAGRMTRVTQTGQTAGRTVADKRVDLDYDALGRRTAIDRYADLAGTALVASSHLAHDAAGRQTGLFHQQGTNELARYGWAYDAAGRLIRESADAGTISYKYDADGQLTNVAYADPARSDETYSYDATGNRTGGSYQTGTGNRLVEDADYTYQYDDEGNRTRRTSKSDGSYEAYWWDHRNRLVRVEFRTAASVIIKQVQYDYDAFDNLIRRRVDANGDGTFEDEQSFVLDLGGKGGLDDVVLTFDGSGSVTNRYLHGPAIDELFADESAVDGILWALADHQGTVKDWIEHDAGTGTTSVFNHVEFDAYGKIVSQTNATHEITAGGYTGRYHDPLTGLRYHRGRWADPATGWISEDPIGFGGGDVNLYGYVGNAPRSFVDPSGLATGLEEGAATVGILEALGISGAAVAAYTGAGAVGVGVGLGIDHFSNPILRPAWDVPAMYFFGPPPGGQPPIPGKSTGRQLSPTCNSGIPSTVGQEDVPPKTAPNDPEPPKPEPEKSQPAKQKPGQASPRRHKKPKPGAKGKSGATNCPSWAKGKPPFEGEKGGDYARRLLDEKYGPGGWKKGPGTEFNQLQKYGDRHWIDP